MRIYHACERHDHADKRCESAWKSWDVLYSQHGVIPAHLWTYPRDARAIGDPRALPYLRDVLSFALDQMDNDDILMWTNDDIHLHPDLPEYLLFHVPVYGACTSQRVDFRGAVKLNQSREEYAKRGRKHLGRDMVAATKRWFIEKWEQIGDPICGASDFDLHLAAIVRLDYGIQTTRGNIAEIIHPAEIPLGMVQHQHHTSAWSNPRNINTAASQKHNRANFKHWATQYLPSLHFHHWDII